MMKAITITATTILFLLISHQSVVAQGFEAPSDSNAVVYFVRVTKYAKNTIFDFFHETNLVGKWGGANYTRIECEPGKNLFWASSENKQFLNCDLKAGGTYIFLINITMGFWKSNLTLEPITPENEDFQRVINFVKDNKALKMSQTKLDAFQEKLEQRGFVASNLSRYENEWKHSHITKNISPDMAIPVELLK